MDVTLCMFKSLVKCHAWVSRLEYGIIRPNTDPSNDSEQAGHSYTDHYAK